MRKRRQIERLAAIGQHRAEAIGGPLGPLAALVRNPFGLLQQLARLLEVA